MKINYYYHCCSQSFPFKINWIFHALIKFLNRIHCLNESFVLSFHLQDLTEPKSIDFFSRCHFNTVIAVMPFLFELSFFEAISWHVSHELIFRFSKTCTDDIQSPEGKFNHFLMNRCIHSHLSRLLHGCQIILFEMPILQHTKWCFNSMKYLNRSDLTCRNEILIASK